MTVYIDADACPVTELAVEAARARGITVVLVCDRNHVLRSDYARVVVVDPGRDAADLVLINLCRRGDVVVTQDTGVGALALGKGAAALHPSGRLYTQENIDSLLLQRHLSAKARRSGKHIKGPAKRTALDDARFREAFSGLLEAMNPESEIQDTQWARQSTQNEKIQTS